MVCSCKCSGCAASPRTGGTFGAAVKRGLSADQSRAEIALHSMDGTLKGDPLKAAVKKLVDLNAKYLTPGSSAAAACPAGGSGGGASSSSASVAAAAAAAPSPPRRASPSSGSSRPWDLTPMKPEAPREFREDRSVR